MMKKNSLTTLIILIIFVLVAVRFFWLLPIVAIILFVSVFRLVRNILNQNQNQSQKEEDPGQKTDTEFTQSHYQRKESTIITCDYCGSKVDTGKHAVCNHCGGPYGDDEEWKHIRNRKMM